MFRFAPVAPCPTIGCHQEEPGSVLPTLTFYIFINVYKVTPQSPPLQAKETQLPQPFLKCILHVDQQHIRSAHITTSQKHLRHLFSFTAFHYSQCYF